MSSRAIHIFFTSQVERLMQRNAVRTISWVLSLLFGLSVVGANAATQLTQIDANALPGDQVQLRLKLSDTAPQPLVFTVDNPARISMDLADTTIALPARRIDVKRGVLDTVNVAEANGRTRVVLNLNTMVPYDTKVDGDTIIVTVGSTVQAGSTKTTNSAVTRAAAMPVNRNTSTSSINRIDFRRGSDGSGRVIVQLSSSRVMPDLKQEGGRMVINFPKATVDDGLLRRLDVADFATPVNVIDTVRVSDGTRIVISAAGDWEPVAYQTEDVYTVEIRPVNKAVTALDKKEFKGERLTLNFQDIDTRAVLQLLADTSGQNMVISDAVQGNVTLRLQNVPWDQALDIVMQTKGLDMRRQGNVMLIAPAPEIAAHEKSIAAAKKDLDAIEQLRSEFLQVNYAKAQDLADLIKGKGNSLMSERGSVTVDSRTNTLLLQDTPGRLADIRRLVSILDIPVRQVLIEARIVIVNDDFKRELGARFGVNKTFNYDRNGAGVIGSGPITSANPITIGPTSPLNGNFNFDVTNPSSRYMVDLPAAGKAGAIALSLLDRNYIVDLELSAAQAEGRGEVVSAPKVITANQKQASIEQGVEIPYQQSSGGASGATTIAFKKAVLSLKVTPQITPDDRIILDLQVNKDSVGEVITLPGNQGSVPTIDTRNVSTQVLVNDGQTVVLGGIQEIEKRNGVTKVPLLGDIPVLGNLFKNTQKTNNKDELLIFVTPKILREGANVY
ncbi:MAG TPA: type IV pilus secretin PilQ [Steroidobacteraceae bacterium]|nr:type IV pilus secretin PilQ [Steroidobacteraceae bacterium]